MNNLRIKKWSLWFGVGAVIVFLFFISRDSLARLAWQKYRWPHVAILLDRSDANLAMFIGSYYFNGLMGIGEYNTGIAKKAYTKAISINPQILWGHYQLARIYFVKGDSIKALEYINKELFANPENLRSLYVRGLIYGYRGQAGDLEKAEADFRRFTGWVPKEWAGYNDLAWILSKQEKYEEAGEIIKQAFREVSGAEVNPWLWNALGVAELNLKKYPAAADSFKKAKKLAENLTEKEWRISYPGNDPSTSSEGLAAFISAINENLYRARKLLKSNSVD